MNDIGQAFNAGAARYDTARRQLVPCLDEYYAAAVASAPFAADAALRILDLGAGTGLLAQCFLDAFPNARLTLIDLSDQMLQVAHERFAAMPAVSYRIADYAREPLPSEFDLVISGLSIHHLSDPDKRGLFGKIFAALRPGGAFINADQVLGPTSEAESKYRAEWLRQVKAKKVSEADLAAALQRMTHDRMATLSAQLAWLGDAGFVQVDCVYKNWSFAVFGGRKPG